MKRCRTAAVHVSYGVTEKISKWCKYWKDKSKLCYRWGVVKVLEEEVCVEFAWSLVVWVQKAHLIACNILQCNLMPYNLPSVIFVAWWKGLSLYSINRDCNRVKYLLGMTCQYIKNITLDSLPMFQYVFYFRLTAQFDLDEGRKRVIEIDRNRHMITHSSDSIMSNIHNNKIMHKHPSSS